MTSPHHARFTLGLSALGLSLTLGCTTTPQPKDPDAKEAPKETPKTMPKTDKAVSFNATTPVGQQATWVFALLNEKKGALTEDEAKQHFSDTFLSVVPPAQLGTVSKQLAANAPFTIKKLLKEDKTTLALLVSTKSGTDLIMSISVEQAAPHKMQGLLFQPAPKAVDPKDLPQSWKAIDAQIIPLAATTQVYAAKIDPKTGQCTTIHTKSGDTPVALGSTFKVYVLAASAKAITDGKFKWTDTIAIDEKLKSLPSGQMQNDKPGTTHTVKHVADKMISISDNTATDHLLLKVGRAAVEGMLKATGNTSANNLPFLTTREMFNIKLGLPDDKREAYAKADAATRRKLLKGISTQPLPELKKAITWKAPRNISTIEWFASAQQMCALHGHLIKNKTTPAYATAMTSLAINDGGLKADKATWPFVGYKGGSEPGVLHMSYVLQHKDGTWYSMTMALNDTQKPVDISKMLPLVQAGFRLLK